MARKSKSKRKPKGHKAACKCVICKHRKRRK